MEVCSKPLTWRFSSRIYKARADSHEQDSFAFVKRIILRNSNIKGRFANGVRSSNSDIDLIDKIGIRHTS